MSFPEYPLPLSAIEFRGLQREAEELSVKETEQLALADTYRISPGSISGLGIRPDGKHRFTLNTMHDPSFVDGYNGEEGGPHLLKLQDSMRDLFHHLRDSDDITAGDLALMTGAIFREAVFMTTYGDFQPELPVGITFGFGKTAGFDRPTEKAVLEAGVWIPPSPDEVDRKGVVPVQIDPVYGKGKIYLEAPFEFR